MSVPFNALGASWQLNLGKYGAWLYLVKGPPCKNFEVTIQFGPKHSLWHFSTMTMPDFHSMEIWLWADPIS